MVSVAPIEAMIMAPSARVWERFMVSPWKIIPHRAASAGSMLLTFPYVLVGRRCRAILP